MIGQSTAFSGALMVLARLISRVIDLMTMLILARMLVPADFGLVAIAMTVVSILEAALELPLSEAMVRLPELKQSHYDTAFTLGLLRGLLICALVSAIAVPFANFYGHKQLVPLIAFLSLAPAARGLLNPRLAYYAKNLNFAYEFRFELVGKIAAFLISVATALLTHSYWSIAVCTVGGPLVIALQSYVLFPFRPRLTLVEWRKFVDFLGWITLSQIVLAITWQSDQLLLGKVVRPAQLGLFSIANNVTNIPLAALFGPLLRPLLSAFTMLRDDRIRLQNSFQSAASAVVAIGLPILVGQSLVAGPMVRLLLGPKWLGAIPFVSLLDYSLIPVLFGMLLTPLSMAQGETRAMLWRNMVQMCVKLPLVIAGALLYGFMGVIAARIVSEIVTAFYCMVIIRHLCGLPVARQFFGCWRSVAAVLFMAGVLKMTNAYFGSEKQMIWVAVQLFTEIAIGAVAYAGCLLFLWLLAGKPQGLETLVLRLLAGLRQRLARRSAGVAPLT
ncbi:MAG TPA: lipopolysaccharide biosynthesis protein [Acidocella sp.]|jgi:PST family polysaccharide transporter|nr:lipopolysaccharide biosynthesis protein [Acidocella sp.]